MNQDHRPGPDPDRILVAELTGTARHHARWRELAQDEQDAAVTELRELAGGRADLLAEVAGIFEGTSDGELDEPLARSLASSREGRVLIRCPASSTCSYGRVHRDRSNPRPR